jgi:hypothetical protein
MTNLWGPHIWNFLHIFCEKINNDKFVQKKTDTINFLQSVATNLPCPECSEDAINILNNHPIKVNNKKELIKYIYYFHNHINEKLNKENYNIEGLEIYKKGNIHIAFKNYIKSLEINNKANENLILHRFGINRNIKKISEFFHNNLDLFT